MNNNEQVFDSELQTQSQPVLQQPAIEQPAAPQPIQPPVLPPEYRNNNKRFSAVSTIIIVIISLIATAFMGLFIWAFVNYNDVKSDVDAQINYAVNEAVSSREDELEKEFAEREKEPYKTFSGPVDYGELSFKYPKTWSVYINYDYTKGGDYEAYLNPSEVNKVAKDTVNALRVSILNKSYDDVIADYEKKANSNNSNLKSQSITVNKTIATEYVGTIPNTSLNGYIVIFKIRDKAVILQTDAEVFKADFDKILSTVTFNS